MTPITANAPDTPPVSPPAEANGHIVSTKHPSQLTPEEFKRRERLSLEILAENKAYFDAHENELLETHPEWRGSDVAIACRTSTPILAVHRDSGKLWELAEQSAELLRLAKELKVPPGCLYTTHLLGDPYLDS